MATDDTDDDDDNDACSFNVWSKRSGKGTVGGSMGSILLRPLFSFVVYGTRRSGDVAPFMVQFKVKGHSSKLRATLQSEGPLFKVKGHS